PSISVCLQPANSPFRSPGLRISNEHVNSTATQGLMASQGDPLAVIDIGSNTGRVTVLRLESGAHVVVLGDARVPLRLVRDLAQSSERCLSDKTIEHTIESVRGFQ